MTFWRLTVCLGVIGALVPAAIIGLWLATGDSSSGGGSEWGLVVAAVAGGAIIGFAAGVGLALVISFLALVVRAVVEDLREKPE